ncbi:MAG: ATP-dependent DNA/RNA helicase [Chrysothrix sp. TS-e1954]|nr:MAG: ATP-dependent DNA/RNA helicase [Chrysothrix sp. TS-e1954]
MLTYRRALALLACTVVLFLLLRQAPSPSRTPGLGSARSKLQGILPDTIKVHATAPVDTPAIKASPPSSLAFGSKKSKSQKPLNDLSRKPLRQKLSYYFPYDIQTKFPAFIWQTWKYTPASGQFQEEYRPFEAAWSELHPGFVHEVVTDETALHILRHLYSAVPETLAAYEALPNPILKADFFRYLILLARGGIYSDIDTQAIKSAVYWVPDEVPRTSYGLVIGIEADPDREDWADWYSRRIQFCQWTIQAKAGHPVLREIVAEITERTLQKKKDRTLANAAQKDTVEFTGPAVWTDTIMRFFNDPEYFDMNTSKGNITWRQFTGITAAKKVGDVVVLPITAFSPGIKTMNAGDDDDPMAFVKHYFEGTWKPESERHIGEEHDIAPTMKRKLDSNDVPIDGENTQAQETVQFEHFGLDPRLLQALAKLNFARPTLVQQRAIPLALDGKHLLARAGTGTGKTAAYLLPILQTVLRSVGSTASISNGPTALVLVPTRELASQVARVIADLTISCSKEIQAVNISTQNTEVYQQTTLASSPQIVVSTPSRAVAHLKQDTLRLDQLRHLVIDEADLVLSYGHEEEFYHILKHLPSGVQTFLASATITIEVETLKDLFTSNPVVLDLSREENSPGKIFQYSVACGEQEKYLILFALLKLKLVGGKCIIFAATVDRCYHLRLFLQSFGIPSCVLNSELPVNCRTHVVAQFNDGASSILIATDDHEVFGSGNAALPLEASQGVAPIRDDLGSQPKAEARRETKTPANAKSKRRLKSDKEYGIARGIDFQNVACVLNFDLPNSKKSYIHRIGRTARAGRGGTAISLAVPKTEYRKHKTISVPSTQDDETTLTKIIINQRENGQDVKPYHFDMEKLNAFHYRVASALKATTPGQVRQARLDELRQELLKSEKLKRHLEENPEDLKYLRHDMTVKAGRLQPQLKNVPDYLLPGKRKSGLSELVDPLENVFVGIKKPNQNRVRRAREMSRAKTKRRPGAPARSNPLKSFKV